MKYYRIWSGDENDRSEITNYLFKGKEGLWKAKDINSVVERVKRELITKEARPHIEETGDDQNLFLEVSEYYDEDGNWLGFEPPTDTDDPNYRTTWIQIPNYRTTWIQIEEVEVPKGTGGGGKKRKGHATGGNAPTPRMKGIR